MERDNTLLLERVQRGAAWLDETKPDWFNLVNTGTLQMASSNSCIVGQVFAAEADTVGAPDGYSYVWVTLDHTAEWLQEHAFLMSGRDEWIDTIDQRRSEAAA